MMAKKSCTFFNSNDCLVDTTSFPSFPGERFHCTVIPKKVVLRPMNLAALRKELDGELFTDETTRRLYATDASAYREMPLAVAIPKTENDLVKLVKYAAEHGTSVIPRTAGTSLAGQVVGAG